MNAFRVLSSIYDSNRIKEELLEVKALLRSADEIVNKRDLMMLVDELREAYQIINLELSQYDIFVNMLDHL